MSLVLAAHALGYGANWITEWYTYDRGVLDALGLAPHERIAGFIHIGRPPGSPEDRPRPPLNEIATRLTLSSQITLIEPLSPGFTCALARANSAAIVLKQK
jgi:hypothetical protein